VTINDVTLNEGTGGSTTSFTFTVTRNDNFEAFSLTVNTANGTATVADNDYTAISGGTVSFTAGGAVTATMTVLVNHDNKVEANETFTVVLSGAPGGVTLADDTGLGTITNDDAAVLTLSGGASQTEGASFTFTATLNNPVQGGFSVAYTTNNGTATTADNDYTDNDGSLSFTGTAGETKTITVNTTTDNKVELDETFTEALGAITGAPAGVTKAGSPQTGTILNDDAAVVSLAGNVSQAENLTPQVFTVNLSNPVDVTVAVLFNTSNGTATTVDNDYTAVVNQTVTFAAGTTTAQIVNVAIINDTKVEADEVYNVAIGTLAASGRNVSLGTGSGTGTITNDDSAVVTLSGGGAANEGNTGTTSRVFTATLNNPVQGGFTLPYATNDGTATTADNDYVDNDGPALVFAGTASEAKTITILVNGDSKVEANETFTLTLGAITGAPPGVTTAGSPQTGTITNDELDWGDGPDSLPTLFFYNGARHATVLGFQLGAAIDGDPDGQPGLLANGDDTDADGDDEDGVILPSVFVRGTTAIITVNASQAGKLDAWMDFNWNRNLGDAGEKIFNNVALAAGDNVLTFSVPGGAVVGSSFLRFRFSSSGGLSNAGPAADGEVEDYRTNIVSNQFSIDNPTVAEGNASTTPLTFSISRTTNNTASSMDYAITGGTATSGSDYASLAAGTINYTAGGPLTQTITVTVNGDLVVEDNETVIITLSNPVNGGIGTSPGTGTITNDDMANLILSGGIAQNEGNSGPTSYTITATLSAAVQGGFQVPYSTNNGTATTADNDYTDNDGTLTFTGTAGETKTITVLVNGDNKVELNETFTVALGTITASSVTQIAAITKAGSPQTGTITNDDAAVVAIAGNINQPEATTPQTFSVILSNPVDVAVTVLFSTTDGTATTGDNDYNGIAGQTVTFPAGTTTTQTVPVTINNDTKVEDNEVYNVSLATLNASGRNVSLGTSAGTGTILNDDAAVLTLSGGISQNEGNTGTTPFVFTATLNNAVQGGFTVAYTTNNGTATTADLDYVDNDGSVVFAGTAGETKTITVLVNGDFKVEPNETFTVALSTISGVTAVQLAALTQAGSPQTATILNDEVDYGDAPDTYSTLLASNGARHNTVFGFNLGATIDGDADGQPNANASGDGSDEDGVTLPSPLITNTTANVTVSASASGKIDAWVDFNNNGSFGDAGEKVFNNVSVVAGNNTLSFPVPNGATPSFTFARFRFSSVGGLSFNGSAADGEVEDYQVQIVNTQFSINDPSVNEGNAGATNLVFTVTRSNNASACSVNYAITGGTATTADNDYQVLAAGTLNFTAGGSLTAPITVVVNGDTKVELNETVDITLSAPVNGTILDGSGTGTITNDDAATITITNPTVTEGDTPNTVTATFTINMSNPSDANVSVNYTTVDGTATTANNDYLLASGSHTFTPGQQSKTVAVTVNGDCAIETNETFLLRLSALLNNGRNIALSSGGPTLDGTGTINNDDALPVMTCPSNFTVNASPGVCNANVAITLPATFSICGASVLEFRHRPVDAGNVPTGPYTAFIPAANNTVNFAVGRYEIEWRITDGSGAVSCSHFLTVVDNQPPSMMCKSIMVNLDAFGNATITPAQVNNGSFDNCTLVTLTLSQMTFTCANIGPNMVTLTGTDQVGNMASCIAIVTVKDVIAPIALCKNITVQLNGAGTVTVPPSLVNNGSSDVCGFTLSLTPNTFTCANVGNNTVTLKVTDPGNNMATCTATVTVKDLVAPTALCKNITVFLNNIGYAHITPAQVNNGSFDACGIATLSINNSDFYCGDLQGSPSIVQLTVKDVYNNKSSCLAYVTVKDAIAPTAVCEDVTVQLNAQGKVAVVSATLAAGSYDNCSVWSYSPSVKSYTCANLGNNNFTITVKDYSNNAATCISVVTVLPPPGGCPGPQSLSHNDSGQNDFIADVLEMQLRPNPTEGDVTILFQLPEDQPFTLQIFDMTGRVIRTIDQAGAEGENVLPIDLGHVPSGLYLIDLQSGTMREQKRLTVQR